MSDQAEVTESTESQAANEAAASQGGNGGFTPPASQADLDKIISERLARERAKFSDYEDLKSKASEYDKVVEANKTEAQKQAEALAEAQARVKEFETREQIAAWKAEVSSETGVPVAALAGATKDEIQSHAEVLKSLIAAPGRGPVVPSQGSQPARQFNADTADDWFRNLAK